MIVRPEIALRSLVVFGIVLPLAAAAQKGVPTSVPAPSPAPSLAPSPAPSLAPSPAVAVSPSPVPSVSPSPTPMPSGIAVGKSETSDLPAALFGLAGQGKYLIPLNSSGSPVPRSAFAFKAAYCPKSGRHAVRYLREQKGKSGVDATDIEVPWTSVPGSVYQVEGAPLADDAESGCLLVTEDFEKSHTLLKEVPAIGECEEAVSKTIRNLPLGNLNSCTLRSRIGDALVVEFTVKSPDSEVESTGENSDSEDEASSIPYVGIQAAGGMSHFEVGGVSSLKVGPFFRTQDGKVRFLLIWEQTESSSIPWTLEEATSGGTRTLIELVLYNQAGG